MATLSELLANQAEIERKISSLRHATRAQVLAEIRELMLKHGLTAADIMAASKHRDTEAMKKVAPKYRDPGTGVTWTGRGLKPKWLVAKLVTGGRLEDFLI